MSAIAFPVSRPLLPKWSVVCVVRNQVQDLMKWMREAMAFKSQNWEMLIVDLGSHDGTHELVTAIQQMDPRIRSLNPTSPEWLNSLKTASNRTLGDFIVVQLPGKSLPNIDELDGQRIDQEIDLLDLSEMGDYPWPVCRRGFWIQSSVDAAEHQAYQGIIPWLLSEGAIVGKWCEH